MRLEIFVCALVVAGLVTAACSHSVQPAPTSTPTQDVVVRTGEPAAIERESDVPELPFPDNPDPDECGIPTQWGKDDPAWLTGYYEGELVQPTVFLYDSHLRKQIVGEAPTGTEVTVILYQANPVLDFYLVRATNSGETQEGWVPAPFLSFEPVESAG